MHRVARQPLKETNLGVTRIYLTPKAKCHVGFETDMTSFFYHVFDCRPKRYIDSLSFAPAEANERRLYSQTKHVDE